MRRKIATRRAKEDRQAKIEREEDRKQRREEYLSETKAQWEHEKADDTEAYERWADREKRRAAGEPVSEDDEDEDGENAHEKAPPQKPVFNEQAALKKFDDKEENAVVVIPKEVVNDIDDDWPMTDAEEKNLVDQAIDHRNGA